MDDINFSRTHRKAGQMLTAKEAAAFLHIHICTLHRWSNTGKLESYRIGPRADRRFFKEDLVRFLDRASRSEK